MATFTLFSKRRDARTTVDVPAGVDVPTSVEERPFRAASQVAIDTRALAPRRLAHFFGRGERTLAAPIFRIRCKR